MWGTLARRAFSCFFTRYPLSPVGVSACKAHAIGARKSRAAQAMVVRYY